MPSITAVRRCVHAMSPIDYIEPKEMLASVWRCADCRMPTRATHVNAVCIGQQLDVLTDQAIIPPRQSPLNT